MKFQFKLFLKTFIISVLCCAIFISVGYFYLDSKMKEPTENKAIEVPYAQTPQNAGLLFEISGEKALIYLDFEDKSVSVVSAEFMSKKDKSVYGYSIDYTVEGDYNLLAGIIDILGGIELDIGEEPLIYTGVQTVEILSKTPETKDLGRKIIEEILKKIAINGFWRQDFLFILENSVTNLTVPNFYYWQGEMKEICKTVRILD